METTVMARKNTAFAEKNRFLGNIMPIIAAKNQTTNPSGT